MKRALKIFALLVISIMLVGCGTGNNNNNNGNNNTNNGGNNNNNNGNNNNGGNNNNNNTNTDTKKYESASFTVEYPKEFTAAKNEDLAFENVVITFNTAVQLNILKETLPVSYTLEQYYQAALNALKTMYGLESSQITTTDKTFGSYQAKLLRYTVEGITLEQVTIMGDKAAYVITYGGLGSDFDKYHDQAETIYNSFRIK